MTENYTAMWRSLGMNLANHDSLLQALGKMYKEMFLSQKNRPEATSYLDFVISEIHGLRIKELVDARAAGKKVVGTYCTFVPEELVIAADGIMIGLCAGADFATSEAEKYLPRNTCSLIKSTLGFKLGGVCPYIEASDMIVGENTCDGKKKAYEVFRNFMKEFYTIDIPNMKTHDGKKLMKSEFEKLKGKLEQLSGMPIAVGALKTAIDIVNNKRRAVYRLSKLRAADPPPISGLDSLLINQIFFYEDPMRFTVKINELCEELERRVAAGMGVIDKGKRRLLIAGCPMSAPNWKLHSLIESSGAVVVAEESCTGERGTRNLVDNSGSTMDALINAITDRYFKIDCAIFTPNEERLEHIKEMAQMYHADGVVLYSLQFCSPYMMENMGFEQKLEIAGIPVLRIETDYSSEDIGQLKTRVQAVIERGSQ